MTAERQKKPKWEKEMWWHLRIHKDAFPALAQYHDSIWADWELRIKQGHQVEFERYERLQEKWENEGPANLPDDWLVDDVYQSVQLTNNMYAAIVVSIWAKMEQQLKGLTRVCLRGLGSTKRVPYKFPELRKLYQKKLNIDFRTRTGYAAVDAVRILNNVFKHQDGRCKPSDEEAISPDLRQQWDEAFEESPLGGWAVDYTKIPIKDCVAACHDFHQALVAAVRRHFQETTGETGP